MGKQIAIYWFRQDLRLADNPALSQAAAYGLPILPIYILDDENAGEDAMGGASRWWLHHSLQALDESLGGKLALYRGNPQAIFAALLTRFDVDAVYWQRCYEPWRIRRDTEIKAFLQGQGVAVHSENGALLWEPRRIKKQDGTPYKVFTPFYIKGCLNAAPPRLPLAAPDDAHYVGDDAQTGLDALQLLPDIAWHTQLASHWAIGEAAAHRQVEAFMEKGLPCYQEGRDFPAKPCVSRLSPYLHFGQISPNQLWHGLRSLGDNRHIEHFCRELGWREFSYHLLYHQPQLPRQNLQTKFDHFPWLDHGADFEERLHAWQRGRTGVPMVDAGMRELWQTGYMHNRVRMIVGSFLVKNLRLHWRHGARWFWDTLLDADLANNSAGWQWIAGCGADAAPYFRIFNPVSQGRKFDPAGEYIRRYVPEIAALPDKYLFSPWDAPPVLLQKAGIELGATYPYPVVDLKESRAAALAAFQSLKQLRA